MGFYEPTNAMRPAHRHHPADFRIERNTQGTVVRHSERYTLQDFYNAFASVWAYSVVWGLIALAAYTFSKPYVVKAWDYVQLIMGHDLL